MGSCFNSSKLSRFQFWIDCINLIPKFIMKFLVILSLAAMAMARPQEQPASFACPNYPFCAIAANAPAPQQYQPHQDLYLAQRLNPGVTIHQAREAQVLMEQE